MTQAEVLKFLEKNRGKKFTTKELKEIFNGKTSIATNLKKLKDQGCIRVDYIKICLGGNKYYCC